MTAMTGVLSTSFRVGRYTCSITLPIEALKGGTLSISACWLPEPPTRLTDAELAEYCRGRDALLAEASKLIGGSIAVVDL